MKLDAFTILLILLGVLVVVTISMNWFKKSKETFVNFQNQPTTGSAFYIPQYSADSNRKVLSINDNLYFDNLNGALIEVFAPACDSNCDTSAKSITDIYVIDREGNERTAIPSRVGSDGNIIPLNSSQSLVKTMGPYFNEYLYTSQSMNTNQVQMVYVSWDTDTYLHVIDLSANNANGVNIKTIYLTSEKVVDTQTSYTTQSLAKYQTTPVSMTVSPSTTVTDPTYINGTVQLSELGKVDDATKVLYDYVNGNIILKKANVKYIYNRKGDSVTTPQTSPIETIEPAKTFVLNDIDGISVIVTSKGVNTVITILKAKTNKYELLDTYRFDKKGLVTSKQIDATPAPSSVAPATTIPQVGTPIGEDPAVTGENSNVCGDDLSCKWYWYFNTIAQKNGNGDTYFSDDYFLKTEAVPPVCPQCPQCPSSGACSNCGGNGGSGCTPVSTSTPAATTKAGPLPPGAVRDNSGNTYVPYKDASGNTRYVLYTTYQQGAAGAGAGTGTGTGAGGLPKNLTVVDKDGQFVSTSDPDTIGGGLALSSFSLAQLGTAGINSVGGVANNVIDSTEGAFGSVTNLAGDVVGSAADLVKGAGSGAVGLVKDFGSGVANLGSGSRGISNDRWNPQAQGPVGQTASSGGGNNGGSLGYTPFGSTSAKTFGNIPGGQTPVDNYSAYGALQSKGGNYMPVTADFSAFRK